MSDNAERPEPRETGRGLLDWLSERLNLTEIFSLLTSYGLFYAELDNRKPIREALAEVMARPLPSYGRWPRVLGLIVVVLVGLEIFTGGLLSLYYLPTPESAHASVGLVLREVEFGWLMHQLHFWGGQVLLAVLLVRIFRFFVQRTYSAPRELVWVFATLLLLVCLHADLTGRLLPWHEGSYWSAIRSLEVVSAIPVYGSVVGFLVGFHAGELSSLTLVRYYVLHVAVLPIAAIVLIYLHFSTVRRVGLAVAADEARRSGTTALRQHAANLALVLTVLFGVLVGLAVLAPTAFGSEADPFTTLAGARPPWYLLAPFAVIELTAGIVPRPVAGALLFLCCVAAIAVPLLDRGRRPRSQLRRLVVAGALLLLWAVLSAYGARLA